MVLSACGGTVPETSMGSTETIENTDSSISTESEVEIPENWPADEISALMEDTLAEWTTITSIPVPSADLVEGLTFQVYDDIAFDHFGSGSVNKVQIMADGDFTGYAEAVLAAGYRLLESTTVVSNYATYVSEDGTLFILISTYNDYGGYGYTWVDVYPNSCYEFEWPEEEVADLLDLIAGGEESVALPSIDGAESYAIDFYDDDYSFFLCAFGVDAADAYVETLKENDFRRIYYSSSYGTEFYAHPDASFMVSVYYSDYYGGTILYVAPLDDSYVVSWPTDTINEYLSLCGAAEGVTLPVPDFDWEFGILYVWSSSFNIDLYDYNDEDNLVTHLEDYEKQMNGAEGWTYQESQRWTSGDCLVRLAVETDGGSLSIYIESLPSR